MMNLKEWLSSERGRATALAEHLGVSKARVSQMADSGVPAKYMLTIRKFTKRKVGLESMIADKSVVKQSIEATNA